MAAHGMFTTTELVPLLRERGIDLSASQVHRLVTGTPERLSLPVLDDRFQAVWWAYRACRRR